MFCYKSRTAATITAAIMTIGAAAPVIAQDETAEQLLACDGINDLTERLVCFNAVVENLKKIPVTPADRPAPAPDPATLAPAAATATAVATPEVPVNTVAPEPSRAASTSPPTAADNFGRDSMKAEPLEEEIHEEKKEPLEIQATIVRSWQNHNERFFVELDNGQIWQETQRSRRFGLPKVGRSVEISEGRFGAYQMKVEDSKRVAWVSRKK